MDDNDVSIGKNVIAPTNSTGCLNQNSTVNGSYVLRSNFSNASFDYYCANNVPSSSSYKIDLGKNVTIKQIIYYGRNDDQ